MDGKLSDRVSRFLLKYRTTIQSTVGQTPAQLLFGRDLRTRLDLLRPESESIQLKGVIDSSITKEFTIGDKVLAWNCIKKNGCQETLSIEEEDLCMKY